MAQPYDLSLLGSNAFENLVNSLVIRVLGSGATGFAPGADGGRDGYFEGEAAYPSSVERWDGVWYIQSKFHTPHLTSNAQKWLIQQVKDEIAAFDVEDSNRQWPDNWIIATNVDQTGVPETGSFDAIRKLLRKSPKGKHVRFHVWGGRKLLDFLSDYPAVAKEYGHFLTPGHLISEITGILQDSRASADEIIRFFVATQFSENVFTKLDQAGSSSDVRPAVQDLFMDIPFRTATGDVGEGLLSELLRACAQNLRFTSRKSLPGGWEQWARQAKRARVVLVKGGPGQGKSTITQYLSQIFRAHFILACPELNVSEAVASGAEAIKLRAQDIDIWPKMSRIPIQLELKEYAQWYSRRDPDSPRNVLVFLCSLIERRIGTPVLVKSLKTVLKKGSWLLVFDGLDEVPNDLKNILSQEVLWFLNDTLVELDADVFSVCTSRPQGYSGQFDGLDGPTIELPQLTAEQALKCAAPILRFGRSESEAAASVETLSAAMASPNIRELMTTPLQSHIMAVVVRDGGRPPERRWQLFNSFYLVMKKRESLKNFGNPVIARILREEDRLLRSVHMRLGFVLHARAERSSGAQTTLSKNEFRQLVQDAVSELVDSNIDETVDAVMEATTERLVLVSTPESGDHVRFDIRQLQEFFAAEYLYAGLTNQEIAERVEVIGGDSHWREVLHFLLSALVENQRQTDVFVAVQVLSRVDSNSDCDADDILPRRLARAAVTCARLLTEGVLEQDQRDRQAFKNLFAPLSGMLDIRSLNELRNINLPRSRAWFINSLLEMVGTTVPAEHASAYYLLGWLLPAEHPKQETIATSFGTMPYLIKDRFFTEWHERESWRYASRPARTNEKVSPWVLASGLEVLNSDEWHRYSSDSLIAIRELLLADTTGFEEACRRLHFDEEMTEWALALLSNEKPDHSVTRINFGFIDATIYRHNWSTNTLPPDLEKLDISHINRFGGALCVLFKCIRAAKLRTIESLTEVLDIINQCGRPRFSALPGRILALLPIDDNYRDPTSRRHNVTPEKMHALLDGRSTVNPRIARLIAHPLEAVTPEMFEEIISALPRIAINYALNPDVFPWAGEVEFGPSLLECFKQHPNIVAENFLMWGSLQKKAPLAVELIKEKVVPSVDLSTLSLTINPFVTICPISLSFPEDSAMLPLVARALFEWQVYSEHLISTDEKLKDVLTAYGISQSSMNAILDDNATAHEVSFAALGLLWLCRIADSPRVPFLSADLEAQQSQIEQLLQRNDQTWLMQMLAHIISGFSEANPLVRMIANRILRQAELDLSARKVAERLLTSWRERSHEPVSTHSSLPKWLGYDQTVPEYLRQD